MASKRQEENREAYALASPARSTIYARANDRILASHVNIFFSGYDCYLYGILRYTGADVEHTVDRLDSKLNGMQDRLSYIELAQSNMLPLTSLHRSADQRENEELMINASSHKEISGISTNFPQHVQISQVEDQKWTQSLYSYDDHHSMLSSEPERRQVKNFHH